MMEIQGNDLDDVRAHATTYLTCAGWCRCAGDPQGPLCMDRRGPHASLTLRVQAEIGRADLGISLHGRGALAGVFRGRTANLRLFFEAGRDLLGFLCLLTGSQDDISEESASDWVDALVRLCPETYAVLSRPGESEALARVALADTPNVTH